MNKCILLTLLLLSYNTLIFASDTEELSDDNLEQLSRDQPVAVTMQEEAQHLVLQQKPNQPRVDYLNEIKPLLPTWREYAHGTLNGQYLTFKRNDDHITISRKDIEDASKSAPNLQGLIQQTIIKHNLDYSGLPWLLRNEIDRQKNPNAQTR